MQETNKVTDKTQEQLMAANWEDLTLEEKALRSDLERHPKMSCQNGLLPSSMLNIQAPPGFLLYI